MYDKKGNPRYPLDEFLGFRKRQRYSPLVEVKVAEMASKSDYRESSRILKEWTAVDMAHKAVGSIGKRVGKAQGDYEKALVEDLEYSAGLPEGKRQVPYLYTEADGVYVRDLKRKSTLKFPMQFFMKDGIRMEIVFLCGIQRSEERRVGKECRCRWAEAH